MPAMRLDRGRARSGAGWAGTPPWTRAPLLLVRLPAVFLAVVVAAAILAIAASSGPLFLSSAASADLHAAAGNAPPQAGQVGLVPAGQAPQGAFFPGLGATVGIRAEDKIVSSAMSRRGLPPPYLVVGETIALALAPGASTNSASLFYRPGALSHVVRLTPSGRRGVWIPESVAAGSDLRAGDVIRTLDGHRFAVGGVYADIVGRQVGAVPRYWSAWTSYLSSSTSSALFIVPDLTTFIMSTDSGDASWYSPIQISHVSAPEVRRDIRAGAAAAHAVEATGVTLSDVRYSDNYAPAGLALQSDPGLPHLLDHAQLVRSGLRGPTVPIDIAAALIALLLVVAAGAFWSVRRSAELSLLVSRGIGPLACAVRAGLELAPAITIGSTLGWFVAVPFVRHVGPSTTLEPNAGVHALAVTGAGWVAALLAIAAIGAAVGRERGGRRAPRHALRLVPWELSLVVGAVAAERAIQGTPAVVEVRGAVQISSSVLTFPLLALAGAALLSCRLLASLFPSILRVTRGGTVSVFLAARRIAGSASIAVGLVIGIALPVGLFLYSDVQAGSIQNSVTSKYATYLGADHALQTLQAPGGPVSVGGHGTAVSLVSTADATADGSPAQLLAVDPRQVGMFAAMTNQQRAMTGRLDPPTRHGRLTALWINAADPPPSVVDVGGQRLSIDAVGSNDVYPGLRNGYFPMLVVNRAALPPLPLSVYVDTEVWTTNAQYVDELAVLRRAHVDISLQLNPNSFLNHTDLLPITWIFEYLRTVGMLAAIVAVSGVAYALAARIRRRQLASVLCSRMGLSCRAHRASVVIEIATLVGYGWLVGTLVAIGAARLVLRRFDLNPTFPPQPELHWPVVALMATGAAGIMLIVTASVLTQRLMDRANPATVLRTR